MQDDTPTYVYFLRSGEILVGHGEQRILAHAAILTLKVGSTVEVLKDKRDMVALGSRGPLGPCSEFVGKEFRCPD